MQTARRPQRAPRTRAHQCLCAPALPLILLLYTLLAGCEAGRGERALAEYLGRLERPLGAPLPAAAQVPVATPPRSARLQLDPAGDTLPALDFLALRGCALQATVARRNTSLGRLAAPSQHLLLELEFLRHAPACTRMLRARGEQALADTLERIAANKVAQLPAHIYNATLASEEFHDFWQPPAVLGDYPEHTSSAPLLALEAISGRVRRWLAGDYDADGRLFELDLAEVARGDGGSLLLALAEQQRQLQRASDALRQREARGPLCREGFANRELQTLRTVIQRFYLGSVQPWAAALERRRHALLPAVTAIEELLAPVLPPAYRAWSSQRDAQLAGWSAAPARHVASIQALLAGCGGSAPGAGLAAPAT